MRFCVMVGVALVTVACGGVEECRSSVTARPDSMTTPVPGRQSHEPLTRLAR